MTPQPPLLSTWMRAPPDLLRVHFARVSYAGPFLARRFTFGLPSMSWYNSSTRLNLVCTCEELFCPLQTAAQHEQFGELSFECVGTMHSGESDAPSARAAVLGFPLEDLKALRAAGKRLLLLSLGTMLVGPFWPPAKLPSDDDGGNLGENDDGGRHGSSGGVFKALSEHDGKEFAQRVWRIAFEAFGADRPSRGSRGTGSEHEAAASSAVPAGDDWVVIMSIGAKPDALEELTLPSNFMAFPTVPQLELLPLCDAFVTHGGMGSVMEAVIYRVPMAVVPIFGDQIHNADAVQAAGLGTSFRYPLRTLHAEALRAAVHGMIDPGSGYARALEGAARKLEVSGGARRARDLVLKAAARLLDSK